MKGAGDGPYQVHSLANQIKARLYYALRRALSQERRTSIKKLLASSRKRFRGAYLLLHGRYSAPDLVAQLDGRLPRDFEILMIHSAYDRLLPMYSGTPQDLVQELITFCGPKRTLAMPAFFLGGRRYNTQEYYRDHVFDVRRTPSEMGLLTEVFRRMPGVQRSLHPTHSLCALGPLAKELTAGHHLVSTRTGYGTPFDVMARRRTVIAGVGVEYYRCVTQTHSAEDMMGPEFPVSFQKVTFPVRMLNQDGQEVVYSLTVLRCAKTLDNTLLRSLLSAEDLVEWKYRGTAMFFTHAHRVTECLIEAARHGITVFRGPEAA